MTVERGHIIAGKYQLVAPIAAGGMGAVWRARHLTLDTDVAVKVMSAPGALLDSALERFKREARAAAQLRSPHVVQIHDYGVDEQIPYIVMELLEGEDVATFLERERSISIERAATIVKSVAKALRVAHEAGIVHRDLKPANIFLARSGGDEVVKVLDFGIAKEQDAKLASVQTSNSALLGSPLYMSPEQTRGSMVDHRTDLWALAVVLLEMVTGDVPFSGASVGDVFVKICTGPIPPPSQLGLHCPGLDEFFARALERDPDKRFASATELAAAFEQLVDASRAMAGATLTFDPSLRDRDVSGSKAAHARGSVSRRGREADTLDAASAPPAAAVSTISSRQSRVVPAAAALLALVCAAAYFFLRSPDSSAPSPTVSAPEPAATPPPEPAASASGAANEQSTAEPSALSVAAPSAPQVRPGRGPSPTPAVSSRLASARASSVQSTRPVVPSSKPIVVDPVFGLPENR